MAPGASADMVQAASARAKLQQNGDSELHQRKPDAGSEELDFDVEIPSSEVMRKRESEQGCLPIGCIGSPG